MALLLTLIFVSVAIVVLSTLSVRLLSQGNHVVHYMQKKECFNGLEAAYVQCLTEVEAAEDGLVGFYDWPQREGSFTMPAFDDQGVSPLRLSSLPNVEYFAIAQDWYTDGIDNLGDGIVDDQAERFWYTIHAFARNGEKVRQVEAIVEGSNVNVWENAIFAGGGQAGGLINGNVSIHGAVHLLGQNVAEGVPAMAAIDLSGTSLIHNNYDGIPADLGVRVPALPQVAWEGETIDTLDAKLRVKNGMVGMSGNSEIGSAQAAGNPFKETMDGTYVNDGWTGNSVVDDGDRGDPINVWSDNGWDEEYDLGDKVPFPLLTDDWRDPDTGAREYDDETGTWYTHQDFFSEVLVADPVDQTDGIYNGSIDLYTRGDDFYWNATTGEELDGSLPVVPPDPDDDYILFDVGSDTLLINGQITINGDLTMRGRGNQTSIHYTGRAALLVNGNVTLDTDLVSCNNGNPADIADSFPVDNIIGIMASQDMTVGSTSQLSLMGAFYAQQTITSEKQTNVMGTFVSNYFDMGTNVPSIFQVPELADNLPYGMIGDYPILAMDRVSWREIGVEL